MRSLGAVLQQYRTSMLFIISYYFFLVNTFRGFSCVRFILFQKKLFIRKLDWINEIRIKIDLKNKESNLFALFLWGEFYIFGRTIPDAHIDYYIISFWERQAILRNFFEIWHYRENRQRTYLCIQYKEKPSLFKKKKKEGSYKKRACTEIRISLSLL